MKLKNLHENVEIYAVMKELYKYLISNGIPRAKISYDYLSYMYIGGGPGVTMPASGYIYIKMVNDKISLGYYGEPRYEELEVDIHDPNSFPKILEFIKSHPVTYET